MNSLIGHIGIYVGLGASVIGIAYLLSGLISHNQAWCERGRYYAFGGLIGTIVSTIAMEHALITHDFSLAFVAANNSKETPLVYSITGMWSALQGSILLWALLLSGYIGVMAYRFRKRMNEPVVVVALIVALLVGIFFFGLMIGPADPFTVIRGAIPSDGTGPNPLLQDNTLIAFHPVMLYLGFTGFTVPFSFAIATLVTGRVSEGWLSETRRFAIFAWACLTAGVILGAWWSYQVLGWGGFWGWDPVENAALLPWLTGTAYLHSVMVQERRGLLRVWNLSLLIATFSLTILGTFLTRSGVIQSVHAFSDSGIGPALIGFFGLVVFAGVVLIGWRGDRLHSMGGIDSPASREGIFLVNNLLFAGFALVVLLGTVFPLLIQAINGNSITIGRPYFDSFTVPIGIALLFFMAVAPALPWRKASPGVLRSRLAIPAWSAVIVLVACIAGGIRGLTPLLAFTLGAFAGASALRQLVNAAITSHRHGYGVLRGLVGRANGGMVTHLGIVIIAVALTAASSFAHRTEITLQPGQSAFFDGHQLTFVKWQDIKTSNESGEEALVRMDNKGIFKPGLGTFNAVTQATATPSVDSSLRDDVYLSLSSAPADPGPNATLSLNVIVQPLVLWLWVGGGVTVAGAALAAFPGRRRRPTDPSSVPIPEILDEIEPLAGATR